MRLYKLLFVFISSGSFIKEVRDFLDGFGPDDGSGSRVLVHHNNQTHEYRVPVIFCTAHTSYVVSLAIFKCQHESDKGPGISAKKKCDEDLTHKYHMVRFFSGGLLYCLLPHPTLIIVPIFHFDVLSPTIKLLDLDPALSNFLSRLYYEADNVYLSTLDNQGCFVGQAFSRSAIFFMKLDGSYKTLKFCQIVCNKQELRKIIVSHKNPGKVLGLSGETIGTELELHFVRHTATIPIPQDVGIQVVRNTDHKI